MLRRAALVFWLAMTVESGAEAQNSYTEPQMKLAGQIGAVIGLIKRCEIVPLPSQAILRAMRAEGLKEADMTRETAFKARVTEQARTMAVMDGVLKNNGASDAERRKKACATLTDSYGPNGWVRAGLVPGP